MARPEPTIRHAARSGEASYDRTMPDLVSLLPIIVPLLAIQLVLLLLAIYDLFRDERRVRWFPKPVWAIIVVFVNIIGPLLYFFVGREDV